MIQLFLKLEYEKSVYGEENGEWKVLRTEPSICYYRSDLGYSEEPSDMEKDHFIYGSYVYDIGDDLFKSSFEEAFKAATIIEKDEIPEGEQVHSCPLLEYYQLEEFIEALPDILE